MMSTFKVYSSSIALFLMAMASPAGAQPIPVVPVQPDLSASTFTVRVVNGSKIPIYYKLVGGRGKSFVHQTLQPGQSEVERATGGEKVLCVWNLVGNVVGVWATLVDKDGKIVVGNADDGNAPAPSPPTSSGTPTTQAPQSAGGSFRSMPIQPDK